MTRWTRGAVSATALWTVVSIVGCAPSAAPNLAPPSISWQNGVLEVVFAEPTEPSRAVLLDDSGELVQDFLVAGKRSHFEFPCERRSSKAFRLRIEFASRASQIVEIPAASKDFDAPCRASIEFPAGQQALPLGPSAAIEVLAPREGTTTLAVIVESARQMPLDVTCRVRLPNDRIAHVVANAPWERHDSTFEIRARLELAQDYFQGTMDLGGWGASVVELPIEVAAREPGTTEPLWQVTGVLRVRTGGDAQVARWLRVDGVALPVDAQGEPDPTRPADTLVLSNPVWQVVRGWLRRPGTYVNPYDPVAFQGVTLTSAAPVPLNLVIESAVTRTGSAKPLMAFAPPAWLAPRAGPVTRTVVRLAPSERRTVRLPLYLRETVEPGRYERRLSASLLGSDAPLWRRSIPMWVARGAPAAAAGALAAVALALGAGALLVLRFRAWVARLGLEGLTIIALLAASQFMASLFARWSADLLAVLLGPLAIFAAGVGNEGLTSLLLAAAVVLAPRTGTLALVNLTVFLLNAVFTGQVGFVDLLFIGVSIACGESVLALAGLTTSSALESPRPHPPIRVVVMMALALGIANAATLWLQYCLFQVLLRLYFATWYVASVSLVTGLLYGAVGAALGTSLGFQVRRSAR